MSILNRVAGIAAVAALCALVASSGNSEENQALKVIHARKSVRNYTNAGVSKETLTTLMKAGMAAPSAMDRRPWAFVAVSERHVLDELADALPYGKMLKAAGGAIVVCGDSARFIPGPMGDYWVQDCSACAENILLAVESMGLGAVWIGVYPDTGRAEVIRKVLGVPPQVIPLCVISIGYPAGDEKPKDKFDPDNIHWQRW